MKETAAVLKLAAGEAGGKKKGIAMEARSLAVEVRGISAAEPHRLNHVHFSRECLFQFSTNLVLNLFHL